MTLPLPDSGPPAFDLSGLPPNLLVGTSSWSSADWQGVFYPRGARPNQYLFHYAAHFSTVEIDATFYHAPPASTVDAWADRTPPGFVFSAKAPQAITHEKALEGCQEEAASFVETMSRLGDKLGPIVFQFPYVAKGKDAHEHGTGAQFRRKLAAFLEALPKGPRYAVEVRNAGWLDADLLGLLRQHRAALVLTDYYTMPSLEKIEKTLDPLTTDFAFVRFLGNRKEMDDLVARLQEQTGKKREFDEVIVDRTDEMRKWAPPLKRLVPRTYRTFAYFNNHYAGFGPGSARLFARVWREPE